MEPKTEVPLWQQKLQNRMALQAALREDPLHLEKLAEKERAPSSKRPKQYLSGHMAAVIEWDVQQIVRPSMAAE